MLVKGWQTTLKVASTYHLFALEETELVMGCKDDVPLSTDLQVSLEKADVHQEMWDVV